MVIRACSFSVILSHEQSVIVDVMEPRAFVNVDALTQNDGLTLWNPLMSLQTSNLQKRFSKLCSDTLNFKFIDLPSQAAHYDLEFVPFDACYRSFCDDNISFIRNTFTAKY